MLTLSPIETRHPARVLRAMPDAPRVCIPMLSESVRAGFPSPAADYIEGLLDLNQFLVHDEPGTFMVRVEGDSMRDRAILAGDILVVDRGLPASDGDIIVAELDGEFLVRELRREFGRIALFAHHPSCAPIRLCAEQELMVFGVVTAVVRKYQNGQR